MSNSAVSVSGWAEKSEAQRIECVRAGEATLKEMVAGLLDGSEQLRLECSKFLMRSDVCLRQPSESAPQQGGSVPVQETSAEEPLNGLEGVRKRRQGLPQGYAARVHRHESI
jgi:hypothetical protein